MNGLAVNILCRNLSEDRVIPRFSRYLRDSLGWVLTATPVKNADVYYLSCYLEEGLLPKNNTRPVAAYFTHREVEPPNGPKTRQFDRLAGEVALRIVTAAQYGDGLAPCGPTAQIRPPVERERFTIAGRKPGQGGIVAGFSGYKYGNGRKGEDLAKLLIAAKRNGNVTWKASGRGWPVRTVRYQWTDMPAYYQSLDVLVITARVEGVPMPALEALACGVSLVAPYGVGLLDELGEVEGIYRYPAGNPAGLARAFSEAVAGRGRVNREALRAVTEPYTVAAWVEGHRAAFEAAFAAPPAGNDEAEASPKVASVAAIVGSGDGAGTSKVTMASKKQLDPILTAGDGDILAAVHDAYPGVKAVLSWTGRHIPYSKKQIFPYQGAFLAHCAHHYDRAGAQFLEIGTCQGYSACLMATAAPQAAITTLNPADGEYEKARANLRIRSNVRVVKATSQQFYQGGSAAEYDLIFVDGDHSYKMVLHDSQFFNRLRPGGLILFHDYSPDGSARPSDGCFRALNDLQAAHRPADVKVIGTGKVGMLGWIRQEGEVWN